ncbi:hypothetical protein [Burkholderia sp. Bp9031]|uniref:hypothetical protein n=1 Tax=Burkholderia sp. Bp9031 TaxID=2184566 RepID=UPI001639B1FA|nr:hypothetical protein [Burkholderia sp. Bp9031]
MKISIIASCGRGRVAARLAFAVAILVGAGNLSAGEETVDTSPWSFRLVVLDPPRHANAAACIAASADGRVIAGFRSDESSETSRAVRWTAQTGFQYLRIPGSKVTRAYNLSADGSTISGATRSEGRGAQGFRWTKKGGVRKFGVGWRQVETSGISDNGTVVVGTSWERDFDPKAFYWTEQEGVQSLADNPVFNALSLTDSAALGVSGDGSTIVGWASDFYRNHASVFYWTKTAGMQIIGDAGGKDNFPRWMGVSRDGSVVVGTTFDGPNRRDASHVFRWTAKEGMVKLGPEGSKSYALGMSSDGSAVFGMYSEEDRWEFFVWSKDRGWRGTGMDESFLRSYQFLVTDREILLVSFRDQNSRQHK